MSLKNSPASKPVSISFDNLPRGNARDETGRGGAGAKGEVGTKREVTVEEVMIG